MIHRRLWLGVLLLAGSAWAAEGSELDEMKAAMKRMEARQAESDKKLEELSAENASMKSAAAGGSPEAMSTLQKKGNIKIGGQAVTQYRMVRSDNLNNPDIQEQSNAWNNKDCKLNFRIDTTPDTSVFINLALDDTTVGGNTDRGGLIEEAYYDWRHIGGSDFGLDVGKKAVPFGLDYHGGAMISDPYTHGGTTSTYMTRIGPNWQGPTDSNRYGAQINYEPSALKGKVKWENMLFQETSQDREGGLTRSYRDQNTINAGLGQIGNGRTDDNGFRSVASRLTVTPIEKLMMMASIINRHDDYMGQDNFRAPHWTDTNGDGIVQNNEISGTDLYSRDCTLLTTSTARTPSQIALIEQAQKARADTYAASLAASWKFDVPFKLYGEYIHNWDYGYEGHAYANIYSLGLDYTGVRHLTLSAVGEYAETRFAKRMIGVTQYAYGTSDWNNLSRGDSNAYAFIDNESFYRAVLAAKYDFDNGIFMGLEYGHEWLRRGGTGGFTDYADREADAVTFTTGLIF